MKPLKPVIAVTAGDPAGIGPEITLRTATDPAVSQRCVPLAVGNFSVFKRVSEATGLALPKYQVNPVSIERGEIPSHPLLVDPTTVEGKDISPGQVSGEGGKAAYESFIWAVTMAKAGRIHAIVTAPINKESLSRAGIKETGHTEILAKFCGVKQYAMLYWSRNMAVALATLHRPMSEVPSLLTIERIHTTAILLANTLESIGTENPKICVLGLNPQSGEHGLLGTEEETVIVPAVERLKKEGMNIDGPVSPDTAFIPSRLKEYDGFVAMYHDQGSIPFKMLHFHDGVNHTMGLPIIRTSVDHGTAFDIAWKGIAEHNSMLAALELALLLST